MPLDYFHPIISAWFRERFGVPTEPQRLAWPSIAEGSNTLIAAPTGSGKTLSAFLVAIDKLVREAVVKGELPDECKVLYVSPLKALASDIRKNLEIPLKEIQEQAFLEGFDLAEIRSAVRTGDTPQHERQAMIRRPPHILVTTPESLYLMLTSEKGRVALKTVETVIVDEIHALARDKRGSHLALSLERLKTLLPHKPALIGLSATQKPIDEIANFLVGVGSPCKIFDTGHARELDLGLMVPPSPLSTVATHEQWDEVYQQLALEIRNHRSTLIFVNTRRLAERVAYRLTQLMGEDQVLSHHGSLSKNRRLNAEQLLKEGKLKAIVATASLELGIDIGYIDLVFQIGLPFSIATFLQRIGRSGHAIKAKPKGRILTLTRDELIEAFALIGAIRKGQLDRIEIPKAPVDILSQQLIAECAGRGPGGEMKLEEAYRWVTHAWPYRDLTKKEFMEVVQMAAEGYAPGKRKSAYLMWDKIGKRLSVKGGARIAALTSGGAIPEMGDYRVVLEEDKTLVGMVNEDFAIESMAGDIFTLGTHSWQIAAVRGSEVIVRDAHGQPPTIPFWLGEAPGRTEEFSMEVSLLRKKIADNLPESMDVEVVEGELSELRLLPKTPYDEACEYLSKASTIDDRWALLQAVHYIAAQKSAVGFIPTREKILFERFFDEAGGMQLVIHAPYGARVNRGWGLALRKRFCRGFNFELQASADDDGIVLSIGANQGFPIKDLFKMLKEDNVEHFLVQALLAAPMFGARWRWNASRALAILRQSHGKRVPPPLQRFRSEDLLTAVFPAQTACRENAPGDIEVPHHPLVDQTVHDCLTEAMDIVKLKKLFNDIEHGKVELIAKDTREPSPFAYQLLNGYPYTFLDDAPLEERRARAVSMRPALSIIELQDLDRMDRAAIKQVTKDAWPTPKNADEFYEVLVALSAFPFPRVDAFNDLADKLIAEGRAAIATVDNVSFLVAAESAELIHAAYDEVKWSHKLPAIESFSSPPTKQEARQRILCGWLDIRGPAETKELVTLFGFDPENYLAAIEATGSVLRCKMGGEDYSHWCSRNLLRRIHRLTIEGLRELVRPASPEDYLEFILDEHGLTFSENGERKETGDSLHFAVQKLQGFEASSSAWERELFAGRVQRYRSSALDELTTSGKVAFGRLSPSQSTGKLTSVVPLTFASRKDWKWISIPLASETSLSGNASVIYGVIKNHGAQFIDEITEEARLLETQVEQALGELSAAGLITCDHFQAFRNVLPGSKKRRETSFAGRWSLLKRSKIEQDPKTQDERLEKWARQLLTRYGVVFKDLLVRERLAPSWGELVRTFRSLEARGEIRGGRFISGVAGEQFAHSDQYEKLLKIREARKEGKRKGFAVISSSDPLNLFGIITKGQKIPSRASTRLLIESGEVTAICQKNEITTFREVSEEKLRALRLIGTFRSRLEVPVEFAGRGSERAAKIHERI